MFASKPQDIHPTFAQAFNAGSVEEMLALYEENAHFVEQTGEVVIGLDSIREALNQSLALRATLHSQDQFAVTSGDLALLGGVWQMEFQGMDGQPIQAQGKSIVLARRQEDGTWRIVIDHPFAS